MKEECGKILDKYIIVFILYYWGGMYENRGKEKLEKKKKQESFNIRALPADGNTCSTANRSYRGLVGNGLL